MGVEETHECGACHHRSSPRTPDGSLWQCPICGHTNFIREPGDHLNEVQAIPTQTLGSDDDPHPDNVATKALSHGELGDMLFGLEEPSEEKLPAVEPRDTQELPKWAVDTGMISEYGLRAPAGFGLRSASMVVLCVAFLSVGISRDFFGFDYRALLGEPLVVTPSSRVEQILPLFNLDIDVTRFENIHAGSLWVGEVELSYTGEHPVSPLMMRLVGELPDGREWSMPLYPNWDLNEGALRQRPIHELLPPRERFGLNPGQTLIWSGFTLPTIGEPSGIRLEVDFDDV